MKKRKIQGPVITSQVDAAIAFARGDTLPKAERKRVSVECYRTSMSLKKACVIAIKYGLGQISNNEKRNSRKLVCAWLRLGQRIWQRLTTTVTQIIEVLETRPRFLARFCAMFQRALSRYKPMWAW